MNEAVKLFRHMGNTKHTLEYKVQQEAKLSLLARIADRTASQ